MSDDVTLRILGTIGGGVELGDEAHVQRLRGVERISQLFDFELTLAVETASPVDAAALLGSELTLVFERDGAEVRRVHGMITEVDDLGEVLGTTRRLRARLRPRAFRLTMVETQEVYVERSVPDLVRAKLSLMGLASSTTFNLLRAYPQRRMLTQYRESDLALVSRLTEHEGVSFYFVYDADKEEDVMVFTDHAAGFATPEVAELLFRGQGEQRGVYALRAEHRLTPRVYVVQDYDYQNPIADLTVEAPVPGGSRGGVVEYGTHFTTPDEGQVYANIRSEEAAARQLVYLGVSDEPTLAAGHRVTITEHPTFGDLDVLVTEVQHHADLVAVGSESTVTPYSATFRAVPRDRTYRPARVTPRPRIHGVVNGMVDDATTGIDTSAQIDAAGRYVVRLLFDTSDSDGLVSEWIRMAQPHAGNDYGMHFPLKPGTEVMLAFIDGDPDRPVIVGAVPNTVTASPINDASNTLNRLKSASGIIIEYGDRRIAR